MPSKATKLVRIIGAAILSTVACACVSGAVDDSGEAGASPVRGGEVTVLRATDIDSWDPEKALQTSTFETLPQVMEGLVRPGSGEKAIAPGLAEDWDFDRTTNNLTFRLRPGLTFSDGSPLTAADVAFSVDVWRKSISYGTLYSAIESTSTPNERTIVLHLSRPSSFTLTWLANGTAIVIPEDFAGMERAEFFESPIGAGPFKIESHTPGQQLRLVRNDEYYDPKRPYVDSMVYEIVTDPNQQLLQYQGGQADILESVPLDVATQVPEDERHVVDPSATVHAAFINTAKAPGNDLHFRRAVSYAIDRDRYIESVFGGLATPATGGLPTGVQGSAACECEYAVDLDKAKQELAKSSYDGSPIVLLVDASSTISTRGGEVAAEMLRAIGIEVDLQPEETQVMFDRYSKGDYDIEVAEVASVSPSVGDIFGLVSYMVSGSDPNKTIEQAFDELDIARNEAERVSATQQAENWIGETLPYVPIAFPDRVLAVSERVGGMEATPYLSYAADRIWVG